MPHRFGRLSPSERDPGDRGELLPQLTRRELLKSAARFGLASVVVGALPAVREILTASPAYAADATMVDGTLQAFFDTIVPGRRVRSTESGEPVHPRAIAGVDKRPGAVEADALVVSRRGVAGFDVLVVPFLGDLESTAAQHGGDFLSLGFDARVATCKEGLSFDHLGRPIWEAAAFIAFYAFAAAANVSSATKRTSVGYSVMGLPGAAPHGHSDASYERKLSRERAPDTGNLP